MRNLIKLLLSCLFGFCMLSHTAFATSPHASSPMKTQAQIRLLVSLGIPTLVLRQYVRQAQRLHIPLVIRGMYKASMQATGKRVYKILHPAHEVPLKSGVMIDPVWFSRYHVKVVPTLVVVSGSSMSRVSGNLSLTSLLLTIQQHSVQAPIVDAVKTALTRVSQ